MNSRRRKFEFTGGWAVVSDGIADWFVSFVCKGDIDVWVFSIDSGIIEEEEGNNCLIGSVVDKGMLRSCRGGGVTLE